MHGPTVCEFLERQFLLISSSEPRRIVGSVSVTFVLFMREQAGYPKLESRRLVRDGKIASQP